MKMTVCDRKKCPKLGNPALCAVQFLDPPGEGSDRFELHPFDPVRNLPPGWFCNIDIDTYGELIKSLPDEATILEVGVWKGRSICSVAEIIKAKNISVWAVDTFGGSDDQAGTKEYCETFDLQKIYSNYRAALGLRVDMIRGVSWEVANRFVDETFDMVFIDAAHDTESVKADLEAYHLKVKNGGILAGHDLHLPSVKTALERFMAGKGTYTAHKPSFIWSMRM